MNPDALSPPAASPLAPGVLAARREHLLNEIHRHEDAQRPGLRRRRRLSSRRSKVVILVLAAILAAVIALPASGLVSEWFLSGPGNPPQPMGAVVTVTTGTAEGFPWSLKAFANKAYGVCFVIDAQENGAEACGSGVRGEPVTSESKEKNPTGWVGFLAATVPGTSTRLVVGPVAEGVATVTVGLSDGTESTAQLIPAPSDLGLNLGFYVLPLAPAVEPVAITARDSNGAILQRLSIPPAPAHQ